MSMEAARRYTPAEAAALSGVALKAVHNAIDKRIIHVDAVVPGKKRPRALSAENVLHLKLWSEVGPILSQERRQRLFDEIRAHPTARHIKADNLVIVDVAEARKEIAGRARDLEAAEAVVTRARNIMGGEPVFKGTRIPVRLVATMLDDGTSQEEILDGYPKLDARMLALARVWTATHPRRGRPRTLSDRGATMRSQTRTTLKSDPGPSRSASRLKP